MISTGISSFSSPHHVSSNPPRILFIQAKRHSCPSLLPFPFRLSINGVPKRVQNSSPHILLKREKAKGKGLPLASFNLQCLHMPSSGSFFIVCGGGWGKRRRFSFQSVISCPERWIVAFARKGDGAVSRHSICSYFVSIRWRSNCLRKDWSYRREAI